MEYLVLKQVQHQIKQSTFQTVLFRVLKVAEKSDKTPNL